MPSTSPRAAQFLDPAFWQDESTQVLLPPAERHAPDLTGIALPAGAVVFASSGSTGSPKFTVLTRQALLASARAVVDWLGITRVDRLLCPLPLYHVGGFGLLARAKVAGAAFRAIDTRWDPRLFAAAVRDAHATITSLVPAQIHDVVRDRVSCPLSLRLAVVGGGYLAADLAAAARDLGWPIRASFGMTEAGSQIATENPGLPAPDAGWLPVLDGWEVATDNTGLLRLRGDGLFAGRLEPYLESWRFVPAPTTDGWYTTADFADVATHAGRVWLQPRGRADDCIKIRGELIALSALAGLLDDLARPAGLPHGSVALIDAPDPRTGRTILLVGESSVAHRLPDLRDAFNHRAPAYARISGIAIIDSIPRSPLGKLQPTRLRSLLAIT